MEFINYEFYINKIYDCKGINELSILKSSYTKKLGLFNTIFNKLLFLNIEETKKRIYLENFNKFKITCLKILKERQIYFDSLKLNVGDERNKIKNFFDVTLPGRGSQLGFLHPITSICNQLEDFFIKFGFIRVYGLDIEDEYHNFDALNIQKFHPARRLSDTFYLSNNSLLRTHTSSVQIRVMENNYPPYNLFSIGRVYRVDSDATHTPMFHQLEVLSIGLDITFTSLKLILKNFLNFFFPNSNIRYRYSYFPFTEPSAEVDIECFKCDNKGCFLCNNSGWIELLGCGLVHPLVLKNCLIDYTKFSGFAFGVGVDRLAMLKYNIDDLRLNFENDLRFLKQF